MRGLREGESFVNTKHAVKKTFLTADCFFFYVHLLIFHFLMVCVIFVNYKYLRVKRFLKKITARTKLNHAKWIRAHVRKYTPQIQML